MIKRLVTILTLTASVAGWAHDKNSCEKELLSKAKNFSPSQIANAKLGDKNGWDLSWHKTADGEVQLAALQKPNLLLKRLDPMTGATLSDRQLTRGGAKIDSVIMKSTSAGELLIMATRNAEGAIDLYSDQADLKLTAYLSGPLKNAALITFAEGRDIYIVANTVKSLHIFKRHDGRLEEVETISSPQLIRQMAVAQVGDQEALIMSYGLDHQVQIRKLINNAGPSETLHKFSQLGGRLLPVKVGNALMMAILENIDGHTAVRFYSSENNKFSAPVIVTEVLGLPAEGFGQDGRARILLPVRRDDKRELMVFDPRTGRADYALPLGDTRQVINLSQFQIGAKGYYVYSTSSQIGYIHGENETSVLPASNLKLKRITAPVRLHDGRMALAILGEGPNGPSVSIVNLVK